MSETAIRLVIKSRRRLVREGICAYLAGRHDFTVVGQTGAIDELAELCALRRPDAVLVDAVDLTLSKVDALVRLRAAAPDTEVVVTYAEASPLAFDTAIGAGLTALVPCSRGLDVVLHRVRERARPGGRRRPDGQELTDYDVQIVALMSLGHSVREMADLLHISPRTVENHKRRLYTKLGVGNASHAVARATALGLTVAPVGVEGAVRVEEPGRAPLVVVCGQHCPCLDSLASALLASGTPFAFARTLAPLGSEHWFKWHRGPVVVLLVNPTYDDWLAPAALGAPAIVVNSVEPDLGAVVDSVLRGARAIIRCDDLAADLPAVMSVVVRGYLAMDAAHADDLAGWMAVRLASGSRSTPALTGREHDILCSIASGHTIRQTARSLGIALKTVENTQGHLFRKLGARNRAEALAIAHRQGLLDAGSGLDPGLDDPVGGRPGDRSNVVPLTR
jgi:DNA-binding NarL/FixJ family response regulator